MDVVKVINVTPQDPSLPPHEINMRYGGTPYRIPNDGVERIVPADAARLYFGDWDARDLGKNEQNRQKERLKINTKYGLFNAPFYSYIPRDTIGIPDANEPIEEYVPVPDTAKLVDARREYIHPNLPQVAVYDVDGNRILTVIDDPDGDLLDGRSKIQDQLDKADVKAMTAAMSKMQAQIADLVATVAKTNPAAAAELADQYGTPGRANLPSAVPTRNLDVGLGDRDGTASDDAMSVMNDALGIADTVDVEADGPAPAPAPRKKAASRPKTGE